MFFFVLFKVISSEASLILFTRGEGRPASGGVGGVCLGGGGSAFLGFGSASRWRFGQSVPGLHRGGGVGQKPLGLPRGRDLADPPAKSEKWVLRILRECFLVFIALKYIRRNFFLQMYGFATEWQFFNSNNPITYVLG